MNNDNIFQKVLDNFSGDIKFVQVGAHDGIKGGDPIYKRVISGGWKGILIEPLFREYKKLIYNYRSISGLIFENIAIHSEKKEISFYVNKRLRDCSSLFKTQRIKSDLKRNMVKSIKVKCFTLDYILGKHNFSNFDVLQIDVEGSELEVFKSFSIYKYRPTIIHYESKHIKKLGFYKEVRMILESNGYKIESCNKRDDLAVLK